MMPRWACKRSQGFPTTAQINDTCRYRNQEFTLAGISEGELFDVSVLELEPVPCCTACWRGYHAVFAIIQSRLVLDTLHVTLGSEAGPIINGVAPSPPKSHYLFNNHYEGLNYYLEYTGGLLLADGFIEDLYVHMGFHPAWKYQTVIELVFQGGVLQAEFDRSDQMAEYRQLIAKAEHHGSGGTPSQQEIKQFVERAFDRRYWFDT